MVQEMNYISPYPTLPHAWKKRLEALIQIAIIEWPALTETKKYNEETVGEDPLGNGYPG